MQRLSRPEVILALDVDTLEIAAAFVDKLYPKIKIFKVGSHLFTAYGPKVIEMLHKKGAQVFLDLKYLDIPNTVAGAVAAAARQAKVSKVTKPLLIGVTILTSQAAEVKEVLALAKIGVSSGLDGVVCSVREAAVLRQKIKKDFVIITPGLRMNNSVRDDQKRTATAGQAVKAGSNFLVIGRPILKARDPLVMTEELLGDLYGAGD